MTRRIGYARISTPAQSLAPQLEAIGKVDIQLSDTCSGSIPPQKRPGWMELETWVQPGDTVVVWRLDRLGRRGYEIAALVADWTQRGIWVESIAEGFRTDQPSAAVLVPILSMVAEWERSAMLERQAAARRAGRPAGRPSKLPASKVHWAAAQMATGKWTVTALAKQLDVSRRTLRRALDGLERADPRQIMLLN